jgi:hypothetical protein
VADHADRAGQTEGLRFFVQITEERSASDVSDPAPRVHAHSAHQREIDQDPAFTGGKTPHAVTPGAYRHDQVLLPGKSKGPVHIVGRDAPSDDGRVTVDHGIPHDSGRVVAQVAGNDDLPPELFSECGER